MRYFFCFCVLFFLAQAEARGESEPVMAPAEFPSLITSIKVAPPLDFCGERVPLEIPEVKELLEKELLLSLWRRSQVILWLKRCGRYMPYVEKLLKENGLPDDLKYMAVVESSLMPHVGSKKQAIGFWQFIRGTGRKYGLRIDGNFDDRRNVVLSTRAAIRYSKKLYADFGSWTLVAAAYNMGEHGLASNIKFQKTSDFYHLYLPLETRRHIPKIVAAKMILSNPEKYGFFLKEEDYYKPIPFDEVRLKCAGETPIALVAQAALTYFKDIKDMNPEIRGRYLPGGTHYINVPRGGGEGFQARFKKELTKWRLSGPPGRKGITKGKKKGKSKYRKHLYVVKRGDYLSHIADNFGVSVKDIMSWNGLKKSVIHPGERLVIYLK